VRQPRVTADSLPTADVWYAQYLGATKPPRWAPQRATKSQFRLL
jgi:hypothetical protein